MKITIKKVKMIIEKTDSGFSAYSMDHSVYTTGMTIPALIDNAVEAINLFLEDENISLTHDQVKFEIDFKQFFLYYKVLNAKFLAEKIGMNPTLLSQYVQGHKKPSKYQAQKILAGIRQIGNELAEINLIYNQ